MIFEGMKRCSHFSGHDRAEGLPDQLPEIDEIAKDIKALKDFTKIASDRQKALKKARNYEDGVAAILL